MPLLMDMAIPMPMLGGFIQTCFGWGFWSTPRSGKGSLLDPSAPDLLGELAAYSTGAVNRRRRPSLPEKKSLTLKVPLFFGE